MEIFYPSIVKHCKYFFIYDDMFMLSSTKESLYFGLINGLSVIGLDDLGDSIEWFNQ